MQPGCRISSLTLPGNALTAAGAWAIGAALRCNTALRQLDLSDNRCGVRTAAHADGTEPSSAGVRSLALGILRGHALSLLDLSANRLDCVAAADLATALRAGCGELRTLRLGFNRIGDLGASALGDALCSARCTLAELALEYNVITDRGATHLARSLASRPAGARPPAPARGSVHTAPPARAITDRRRAGAASHAGMRGRAPSAGSPLRLLNVAGNRISAAVARLLLQAAPPHVELRQRSQADPEAAAVAEAALDGHSFRSAAEQPPEGAAVASEPAVAELLHATSLNTFVAAAAAAAGGRPDLMRVVLDTLPHNSGVGASAAAARLSAPPQVPPPPRRAAWVDIIV